MESNHNFILKCVLCDAQAEYVMAGDSLCKEHKDEVQINFELMKRGKKDEAN